MGIFKRMTALELYRQAEGLSYAKLGEHLGYPTETVRRWCLGLSDPHKTKRAAIEKRTKGKVKFSSGFVDNA